MKIQVLGSGCPSCHQLFELTKKAAEEMGIKQEVEYSDDIQKIIEMGVMQVPVLAIDNKPVMTGSIGDIERIKDIIRTNIIIKNDTGEKGCSCGGKC